MLRLSVRAQGWSRWCGLMLALGCIGAEQRAPAAGQLTPQKNPSGLADSLQSPAPQRLMPQAVPWIWQYRTAAPLSGEPCLTGAEQIVVGTTEGNVHALSPEGTFAWGYTSEGAVLGSPSSDAQGRVYWGTQARRVYAIEPSGAFAWSYRAQVGILSAITWSERGFIVFEGVDNHLWAYSARAGLLWRVALPGRLLAAATGVPGGDLLLVTRGQGLWRFSGPTRRSRWWPEVSRPEQISVLSGAVAVQAQGEAFVGPLASEQPLRLPGSLWATPSGEGWVVLSVDHRLEWRDAQGVTQHSVHLGKPASGAPVVGSAGEVYVPTADGAVLLVRPGISVACASQVLSSEVSGLRWHQGHLVVWTRTGLLVAVAAGALAAGCP